MQKNKPYAETSNASAANYTRNLVENALREDLLDKSLLHRDKALFDRMTGPHWREFLVGEEREVFETAFQYNPYFELEFYEQNGASVNAWETFLNETTITDVFEKKQARLQELKQVSKKFNKSLYYLVSSILSNDYLIHQLTIVSDKAYRNGVFYIDSSTAEVILQDERTEVSSKGIGAALDHFKNSQEPFFLEISTPIRNKAAKKNNAK